MKPLTIILGIIIVICNVTQDEIRFHWERVFGHWFKSGTKLERWFNPSISWKNKYITNSQIINYLLGTIFIMFTDFWHFLKFIIINCIFTIALVEHDVYWTFDRWITVLLILNLGWGFIYQFLLTGYNTISDRYTK